jgi:hypothetical protein
MRSNPLTTVQDAELELEQATAAARDRTREFLAAMNGAWHQWAHDQARTVAVSQPAVTNAMQARDALAEFKRQVESTIARGTANVGSRFESVTDLSRWDQSYMINSKFFTTIADGKEALAQGLYDLLAGAGYSPTQGMPGHSSLDRKFVGRAIDFGDGEKGAVASLRSALERRADAVEKLERVRKANDVAAATAAWDAAGS